ncbi:MAG: GGDEF domain-containing protein [Firmicutes bacterium]|nr:GGDEF domain-containing protein [Bacillota bacterium]
MTDNLMGRIVEVKEKKSTKHRVGGISANLFAFSFVVIVTIAHMVIIFLIINVNWSSNELLKLMERSGAYQIDATSMQASNTVMSETCSNYIQRPIDNGGSPNISGLKKYAKELNSESRAAAVAERFKQYEVSDEVRSYIENAAELSEQMKDIQMHAIALMASVYTIPSIPELSEIESRQLTQEEKAMSLEERVAYARQLVLERDYVQLRYYIAENIDNCNKTLQSEFSQASAEIKQHVAKMRIILWIAIIAVILVLSCAFIMFYSLIVKPLNDYSKDISANQRIKKNSGVLEMRQLVTAFNGLWSNRNELESILRAAAENDVLTGLPNRYCMQRDLLRIDVNGNTMAVLLFDVDFLKRVNDTEGHLAGDNLICATADCIKECFGTENAGNCYRIGGDEFVVLMFGCDEAEVKTRIDRFKMILKDKNITVSVGYAYTDNADNDSFAEMMEEADRSMYEKKRHIHDIYGAVKNGVS